MIKTIGDLINKIIEHERPRLTKYSQEIKHPTMIGDMYEGLTRDIATLALPSNADLRVVKGKISSLSQPRALSRQIDCMIVEGEGEKIPFSQDWIYPVDRVLMVIEVKKTLYKKELVDSLDLFSEFFHKIYEPKSMIQNLLIDAWRSIHGSNLPSRKALSSLDDFSQALYHSLVLEANMPVRIIIGYEGYKSEKLLREGLINVFQERPNTGPVSLPNQIVAGDSSLLKLNGMPYAVPADITEPRWTFYGSRATRAIHIFLELLFTRLSYYYRYPSSIFGEDLEVEAIKSFLDARPAFVDGMHRGWHIDVTQPKDLDTITDSDKEWKPEEISEVEFVILSALCNRKKVISTDKQLIKYLKQRGATIKSVCDSLRAKRLAYLDGRQFQLLTQELKIVFLPDGRCVAADDNTGRLTRWVSKRAVLNAAK